MCSAVAAVDRNIERFPSEGRGACWLRDMSSTPQRERRAPVAFPFIGAPHVENLTRGGAMP
jgi:hypothetical protein